MTTFNLSTSPNQSFAVSTNGHEVLFRLRTFRRLTYADVTVDGEPVAAGVKCISGYGLLPPSAARTVGGQFMFETTDESYPHYRNFDGVTCRFVYYEGKV